MEIDFLLFLSLPYSTLFFLSSAGVTSLVLKALKKHPDSEMLSTSVFNLLYFLASDLRQLEENFYFLYYISCFHSFISYFYFLFVDFFIQTYLFFIFLFIDLLINLYINEFYYFQRILIFYFLFTILYVMLILFFYNLISDILLILFLILSASTVISKI